MNKSLTVLLIVAISGCNRFLSPSLSAQFDDVKIGEERTVVFHKFGKAPEDRSFEQILGLRAEQVIWVDNHSRYTVVFAGIAGNERVVAKTSAPVNE